jgi:hypothetical protein
MSVILENSLKWKQQYVKYYIVCTFLAGFVVYWLEQCRRYRKYNNKYIVSRRYFIFLYISLVNGEQ